MINPLPIADLLAALSHFHAIVTGLLADPSIPWSASTNPGEWSMTEVACHLRDVEREVHQPRLLAVLKEDDAFLAGVDADAWAETRQYHRQNGQAALHDFLEARRQTIDLLSTLTDEAWARQGQHTFFGPTTLHELVNLAVQHDRVHTRQIENLTGKIDANSATSE
ncbi:MAG: DinB family protein [Chloroflexota bacterium]|jgi:hypothetical protein